MISRSARILVTIGKGGLWLLLVIVLMTSSLGHGHVSAAPPTGFQNTPVVTSGLDGPSGFDIAPDGRIFILERTGKIKIYKNGQLLPTPFADLPSIAAGDRGLIGVAFDPDFATNCYVYFYYTSASDLLNRLVRFNGCGDIGTDGPFVLYQTNSPSQELHVGGSIRFGADGKLYFAVGDNGYPPNGQDLSNPHGKILRINKDGSVPTDNPFYGQPGKLGEIWAYGFRNPWRFQFDAATNQLYGGDVGDYSWEEVNHIVKGGNYGWPTKEGYCAPDCGDTIAPIYAYPHAGESAAVTGGPIYRGNMFPAEYKGDLFFADYAKGFIKHMNLDANGNNTGVEDFDTTAGSVVDLKVAPDGSMYYLTYYPGRLYRITYSTGNTVPVAQASADVTKGIDPLTVHFSSQGSYDPDGTALSYKWDFGDGTTSTDANPVKTFANKGTYTVELTVSDGTNFAQGVPLVIQVGNPPTVHIAVPTDGTKYKAGDSITYNAFANDAAGFDINDAAISTDVIFHHATHTHPFLDNLIGRANTFVIPDHGEAAANTWYEIITTATDKNGLSATASVNIYPYVVNLNFTTNVPGIGVNIDGVPYPNPYATQEVVNFQRELSATPIKKGSDGKYYQFDHWSDGGAIRHTFRAPNADATYSATYVPAPAFKAQYFANPNLSGAPVLTRDEPEINNTWDAGSPDPSVPNDNFSARYVKNQYFAPGRYKFTTASDDGVRLYIDGNLVIDKWFGQNQSYTATLDLGGGMHEIKMEYMEQYGGAYARLNWDTTPDQPATLPGTYSAAYFDNVSLAGTPKVTRSDAAIDFDWGNGSPAPGIPVDNFSAQWTKAETLTAGDYKFTVTADDGVRLYLDGGLILDKWVDQAPTTYTITKSVTAGTHTIKMEYYEKGGGAVAKLGYVKVADPATYAAKYWNLPAGASIAIPTTAPTLTRSDAAIDFDWGNGSPDPTIALDRFVAQWTKNDTFEDGTYTFTTTSDDGIRVYIDGSLVIDRWFDQGGEAPISVDKPMAAGTHAIKVEYYENGGGAKAKFNYQKGASAPSGFTAKYWNFTPGTAPVIPTTNPTLARVDQTIDFNWGAGVPGPGVTADNFITQWAKTETFTNGAYEFTVTADDGVRLYIDNQLVLDKWVDQAATTYKVTKALATGSHDIRMEYYEKSGNATAKLSYGIAPPSVYTASYWNTPGAGTAPAIPTTAPTLTRSDAAIDFDWGNGSPDPTIALDHFVARWVKQETLAGGTYTFTATSDDGIRVFVDNVLYIDQWNDHGSTTYTANVPLTAGTHTIRVEYYENSGGAAAKLAYSL
jgi:glucose/arabinose dehydrogenase